MIKKISKRLLTVVLVMLLVASVMPLSLFANEVLVLDGAVSITDTLNNISLSNGTVTAQAAGGYSSQKTNTITITNKKDNAIVLSFDYTASNYSSFSESSASGSYTRVVVNSGDTITMSIKGKKAIFSNTATLTLSNFSFSEVSGESNVKFLFDNTLGSVTVAGANIENGQNSTISSSGCEVVATAKSGVKFFGWIDTATGLILSTEATFTFIPANDMSVKAVFVGSKSVPHFSVNDSYIFDSLNDAATAAAATSNKSFVLMNDSTLPAGDYTIPSGVTLLIPFDAANTLYKTAPGLYASANSATKVPPTIYRKLTMAEGANITVNGAISVSAQTNASGGAKVGAGSPVGPCGFIEMNGNSSITLNSGAALYAWGFIIGSGNITAKSGAKVYENFQMQDFRGGSAFSSLKNEVFTTSQYYVQNIEVPLTLEAGATEYSYTAINATLIGSQGSAMAFISNKDAMFNLTSGSVTKRYDGTTDRLIIESNGDVSVSPVTLKISVYSLKSSDYILPINSNITLNAVSGTININQDIAILPGTEIIVGKNANCVLGNGTKAIVYDADDWGKYCGAGNAELIPVQYAPSRTYTRTVADLKDGMVKIEGTIDASKGYVYTTAGGANIVGSESVLANIKAGTETVTYQVTQSGSDITAYNNIAITPAKLKNADGTYTESFTGTFTYENGKWNGVCATHTYEDVVTAPTCTKDGYTTHNCTVCGHSYVDTVVAAAHTYEDVVTAPTCTEEGYTTHNCTVCGYSYVDTYVAATGHTYEDEYTVDIEATHTKEGSKSRHCVHCDSKTDVTEIAVLVPDVNGDGSEPDASDLVDLRQIIFTTDVETEEAPAVQVDINDDGSLDVRDLIRLKYYIAGIY